MGFHYDELLHNSLLTEERQHYIRSVRACIPHRIVADLTSASAASAATADVLILGAGISGLTAAHRLRQLGYCPIVTECRDRVGGAMGTQRRDGFQWEDGPNSFTPNPTLLNLAANVGLADQLVWADGKLPRFVYWDGRLLPVPMSPPAAITSQLLSVGGKLRVLRGLLGFVLSPPTREETVREFFTRQLGSQACDRLVAQFVSGVYAGNPDSLSASGAFGRVTDLEAKHGSLFAGILREPRSPKPPLAPEIPAPKRGQLGTFKDGLQTLPQAIASDLGDDVVKLQWQARCISQREDGSFSVEFETPAGVQTLCGHALITTAPAYTAAELLRELQPEAADLLETIPYPHVAAVALGYPVSALPQPFAGFGQLFPRDRGIRTLGTIWTSSLFPGRAPDGYHCLLSYIGGALDPDAGQCTDAELAEAVHRDLRRTLLTRQVEPQVLGVKRWPRAIPQPTLGHRDRVEQLTASLAAFPGLFLCANYLDGVALGTCVERAQSCGDRVAEYLAEIKLHANER